MNLLSQKNYELNDDNDFDEEDNICDVEDADKNDDSADEKSDFNNFGDQKADTESDSKQSNDGDTKEIW